MAHPLEVLADLQLAIDGENIDIRADGERIVVDLPSLQVGRHLLTATPFARNSRNTRRTHQALRDVGLTVEVRLDGNPIALIGEGASPGRLGRVLQVDGVQLLPARSLRAAVSRRPVLTVVVVGGVLLALGWLVGRLVRS